MGKLRCRLLESYWTAVVIVAALLLVGSLTPSPLHRHPEFGRFGPDKLLHFVGHAGLTMTLVNALEAERCSEHTAAILAVGGSTTYGVITNTLQRWIPGRKPERADIVAGVLGSGAGVVVWQYTDILYPKDGPNHEDSQREHRRW